MITSGTVCRKRKGLGEFPLHLQIARSIFSRFTLLVRELIQGIGWLSSA